MQALLDVILPVFLVIGAGYSAVRMGWFSDAGTDALMKFTQNFAIPCLLFKALATIDLSAGFNLPLLFSFYLGATSGFLLGLLGARFLFGRPWTDAVAIGFCGLFSNSVLLGLPITERAYGAGALTGNYAIIALHAPYCYLLGITTMELVKSGGTGLAQTAAHVARAIFKNALILGISLGLAVNISGVTLPHVFTDAIDLLSRAALPAALFGLGGVLVRYKPEGDLKVILMVCAISLIAHPLISWTAATTLSLDRDAFRSVVLTATMAPGVNTYIFANMYGSARRVAATSVLFATGFSVLTVWLWLLIIP
ncbi:MAG: AEC family transporter [Silicimonas sp.]|nr:AEC family transporter [Silicimonas sp.]